jgi:hypothetical protein
MRRREFITVLGGATVAAACPRRAQQPPKLGFLYPRPDRQRFLVLRQCCPGCVLPATARM